MDDLCAYYGGSPSVDIRRQGDVAHTLATIDLGKFNFWQNRYQMESSIDAASHLKLDDVA